MPRWWRVLAPLVMVTAACGPGIADPANGDSGSPVKPSDTGGPVECWCSPNSEHDNNGRAYLCANMSKYCATGSDNDLGWNPLDTHTETCLERKQKGFYVEVGSCTE